MDRGFQPTKDVLYEDIGGEVVLLELATGVYFSLDAVGSRIWNLTIAGRTEDEIVADLTDVYEVSREQAASDVARLLNELTEQGLLEHAQNHRA
jgi:hypothetical protein